MIDIEVKDAKILGPIRLIGINGKIGNGKDTVGKIIQYLTSQEAIVKGSFSDCEKFGYAYDVNWEIKKFAGKLKTIASLLTGIPVDKFEDQEFKKTNLSDEWSTVSGLSTRHKVRKDMTVRDLLQKLGTECMRNCLHENVWVNALFADYKRPSHWENRFYDEVNKKGLAGREEVWGDYPNWIITDMRFPNEMEAIVARGGITIRVVRPDLHSFNSMLLSHASERALDNAKFDYEIINNGSLEDLVVKVRDILIKERIL